MSVVDPQGGELFTCRVYKRLASNPALFWANTYELQVQPDGATLQAMANAAQYIGLWEAEFHRTDVVFDRAVVSTLVPDGAPYDPQSFTSFSLNGIVGQAAYTAGAIENAVALEVCLFVRRDVPYGRAGRALYRRALELPDLSSPAGSYALAAGRAALIQARLDDTMLPGPTGLVEALLDQGLRLAMVGGSGAGQHVRLISGMTVAGVTVKDFNNAYFDKGGPVSG